jgi:hypothetical protein
VDVDVEFDVDLLEVDSSDHKLLWNPKRTHVDRIHAPNASLSRGFPLDVPIVPPMWNTNNPYTLHS